MDNFFSIITVVLNAREDLANTIQSLKEQSFKKFEYIVIDGNSTDGSKELIEKNKDFISKYLIENDNGIYDAMNKGLKISKTASIRDSIGSKKSQIEKDLPFLSSYHHPIRVRRVRE